MSHRRRRAFSRIEAIVLIISILLLITIAAFAIDPLGEDEKPASPKKTLHDAAQLSQVFKTLAVASNDFNGRFPTPGLIDRMPVNGANTPGRGKEDVAANTTANLFSACIMQNYFTPELLTSPVERNPRVKPKSDYNFEQYKPLDPDDQYWDPQFKADLAVESNVSYAHAPMFGQRLIKQWGNTTGNAPVLGNRGPRDGKMNPDSVTCGPHGNWAGHAMPSPGGACRFLTGTTPPDLFFGEGENRKPDNLFAFDDGIDGIDVMLTFTKEMTDKGPVIQHD